MGWQPGGRRRWTDWWRGFDVKLTVMAWLPGVTRAQIVALAAPPSPWTALQGPADNRAVFEGPDPVSGAICLWEQ